MKLCVVDFKPFAKGEPHGAKDLKLVSLPSFEFKSFSAHPDPNPVKHIGVNSRLRIETYKGVTFSACGPF